MEKQSPKFEVGVEESTRALNKLQNDEENQNTRKDIDGFEELGNYNEEDYLDMPPDGGFNAWMCCACISAMNFVTWGANTAFGVFLAFYLDNNMFPGATPTDYALIGGLVIFFSLTLIPYSSIMLVKCGYKTTISLGITMQLAAYIGASFARTLVQIYWTQGVLMGISSGIIFGANSIVLPTWFLRKRALANGISHFGLGVGGAVLSLVVNALLQRTGNQKWALRVLGIISFVVCASTMFFVKIRQTQKLQQLKNEKLSYLVKDLFNWRGWLALPLQLATIWCFLANTGYVICLFSLSNYAISLGFSPDMGTNVIVTLSLGQAVGRPLIGYLSARFGNVNFTMAANFYVCVLIFIWWINIHNYASLICFAFFLGLFIGISSVNVVALVADVSGAANFPSALSYTNTFVAVSSIIAEVIALHLRDYSLDGQANRTPYFYCQLFVGSIYFASFFVLVPYRAWKIDRMLFQLKDSKRLSDEERKNHVSLNEDKSIMGFIRKAFYPARI